MAEGNSSFLVIPRDLVVPVGEAGWPLECGEALPELHIHYETYGELNADKSNAVLVCAPLTADAHAAGRHFPDDPKPGWWDELIGPGKAIDTRRFFVISTNTLGGCRGTTGPSSTDPRTGKPYGSQFPNITIGDMVRAQRELVDHLGIQRLYCTIGGSMGGFQSIKWAIEFPDRVHKCIVIAATSRLNSQALGFEIAGRDAILSDPSFQGGDYYGAPEGPATGLSNARKIAHITYLSATSMERKFDRSQLKGYDPTRFQTGFAVENYLDYQGRKFVDRFDANSYLHITWAMDQYDLEAEYGSLAQAFENVQADILNVNLSSDWLFPPEESRRMAFQLVNLDKVVTSVELVSPYGHDGFLLEFENLAQVVRRFLEETPGDKPERAAESMLFRTRADFALLEKLITPGARILDLGCGDGRLIDALWNTHGVTGIGIDRDFQGVLGCLERSVPVLELDLDQGLSGIQDNSFDFVVLNRTLQEVKDPRYLLREMIRVGRKAVISFPNFGSWKVRGSLFFKGHMPKSEELPFEWYDTPNIHLFTLSDFEQLCATEGLRIDALHCLAEDAFGKALVKLGFRNWGAAQVVAMVSRNA